MAWVRSPVDGMHLACTVRQISAQRRGRPRRFCRPALSSVANGCTHHTASCSVNKSTRSLGGCPSGLIPITWARGRKSYNTGSPPRWLQDGLPPRAKLSTATSPTRSLTPKALLTTSTTRVSKTRSTLDCVSFLSSPSLPSSSPSHR
jgi:hypothetical protein